MLILDPQRSEAVRRLCELIVPGSGRVGPEVYIDALLARMPDEQRAFALCAIEALEQPAAAGSAALASHAATPEFMLVRALACEAFYSDFVAPGVDATGAWEEIDFNTPLATRLAKDWSYMGIS